MVAEATMPNDEPHDTADTRSFEERVFARFDALDDRLAQLEAKVDARLKETRPIWESVNSRLEGIEAELKSIGRRVRLLHDDILTAREGQEELRERVSKLEPETPH